MKLVALQPAQRLILALALAALLVRAVYPPWIEKVYWRDGGASQARIDRYGSLVDPPYDYHQDARGSDLHVDFPRLGVHWFLLLAIGGVLLWAVRGLRVSSVSVIIFSGIVNLLVMTFLLLEVRSSSQRIEQAVQSIQDAADSINDAADSLSGGSESHEDRTPIGKSIHWRPRAASR
jgi:hypothetical protein